MDYQGKLLNGRKHHYAQAFAIYGLSEYYQATREPHSLALAQEMFRLLEKHAFDPRYGGYIEGSSQNWEALDDMRLSTREIMDCRKSMNTLLHILEAYTSLLRVWDDAVLKAQHKLLLQTFQQHVIDRSTGHFKLFFDDQWNSLSENVSYGHDIEGSWLLFEAADVQADPQLLAEIQQATVQIAGAVHRDGLDEDGSLPYEGGPQGLVDDDKSWWVQAEALVGFYNAYQLSGQEHFARATQRTWEYIQAKVVDHTHGDWFKILQRDGTPAPGAYKTGP